MKNKKIIVLGLSLGLMFTAACTTQNPKTGQNTNRNLSTQTRDNRVVKDRNMTGTDTIRDTNMNNLGVNDSIPERDNPNINNPLDPNDMGPGNIMNNDLDTNINNGMSRPGNDTNMGMNSDNRGNMNNMNDINNVGTMNKNAKDIAKKITDLNEVDKASVLINENEAVVGVSLRGTTQGTMTNALRDKIEKMVKKEDSSINKISITTDPSLVTRINTMTTNIGNGNMLDTFADDVRDLIRKITPNSMR